MALHPSKIWIRYVNDVYFIFKCTHLKNFFHPINNLHQNIKFNMEEESNGEQVFLDKENIYVFVYRKPAHTDQ